MSAVVHMLVLIALGLLYVAHTANKSPEIEIVANNWADQFGDPLSHDPIDNRSLLEPEGKILSIHPGPAVDDPYSAPSMPEIRPLPGIAGAGGVHAPGIGNNLLGRDIGSRRANLTAGGGNEITEDAVQNALRWLVRQQQGDGSWSLSGPFDGGARTEERAGATAMALLALQGNGNTHRVGTYRDQVRKGKDFLISRQLPNGTWRVESLHHSMYVHGQCTIALCELYAMTGDSSLRLPAEKAVKFCLDSQSRQGGWRYDPSGPGRRRFGDRLGGDGPAKRQDRQAGSAPAGLRPDRQVPRLGQRRGGQPLRLPGRTGRDVAGHDRRGAAVPGMARLAARQQAPQERRRIPGLVREPPPLAALGRPQEPRPRRLTIWYYATQALHHYGGPPWYRWNNVIRDILPKGQVKSGPEAGSWDPRGDKWGPSGGRLYVTCLSTCILEVYYRHLPIYKSRE